MRISDWSSDVCSSDLTPLRHSEQARKSRCPSRKREGSCAPVPTPLSGADAAIIRKNGDRSPVARTRLDGLCGAGAREIGRASGRVRVCHYVSISVVAVSLQKKETFIYNFSYNH